MPLPHPHLCHPAASPPSPHPNIRMSPVISVSRLTKSYASGFTALKGIDLDINRGEIFALLGPNGAGKTTLISTICGIVNATSGSITVNGKDIRANYREARSLIGLVPQELHTDAFESVWATVSFSRGLFGKPKNPALIEKIVLTASGGPFRTAEPAAMRAATPVTTMPP